MTLALPSRPCSARTTAGSTPSGSKSPVACSSELDGRHGMTQIIVITGASSGFGARAPRAVAKSGHTVYAGLRDTAGRNAPQAEALQAHAAQTGVDLRAV